MVGLHPLGAGHSSTAPLLAFFAHMGTLYIRLSQFSLLVEEHGCVARGLAASLREFLQLYQGSVVRAAGGPEHTEVTLNIVTLSLPPPSLPPLPLPPCPAPSSIWSLQHSASYQAASERCPGSTQVSSLIVKQADLG